MKGPGDQLKELQKLWYKILEDSGFVDIEKLINGRLVLKQNAAHNLWEQDPLDCELEREYFRLVSHKVNDEATIFRNESDRMILQMHADGLKIKDITAVVFRDRKTVRHIIRRYEMAWNIRIYTRRQLNKKAS